MLAGELGFMMMVVEAGIEIDVGMLLQVGPRALGVAILGSTLPVVSAFGIGLALGWEATSAFAAAVVVGPTSLGISLTVLRSFGVLNTPTGQLIVSAAVFDDILGLILLAQLEAIADPSPYNIAMPIASSIFLIIVVGYLAIWRIPGWLSRYVLPRVPEALTEKFVLGLVIVWGMLLASVAVLLKSSRYLGLFLAGLTFCTMHSVEYVWVQQLKRLQMWLLRVFFASTVAFEIPVRDFWTGTVWWQACLFLIPIALKIPVGVFGRPLRTEFLKVGASMLPRGEFSFVIAASARSLGLLDVEQSSAVLLAVLLTVIFAPLAISVVMRSAERRLNDELDQAEGVAPGAGERKGLLDRLIRPSHHAVDRPAAQAIFYRLNLRTTSRFGLIDRLMKLLHDNRVMVLDFRLEYEGTLTSCEAYLRDEAERLSSDTRGPDAAAKDVSILARRIGELQEALTPVVQHDPEAVQGTRDVASALAEYANALAEEIKVGGEEGKSARGIPAIALAVHDARTEKLVRADTMASFSQRVPALALPLHDDEIDDYVRFFRGINVVRWVPGLDMVDDGAGGVGWNETQILSSAHDKLVAGGEGEAAAAAAIPAAAIPAAATAAPTSAASRLGRRSSVDLRQSFVQHTQETHAPATASKGAHWPNSPLLGVSRVPPQHVVVTNALTGDAFAAPVAPSSPHGSPPPTSVMGPRGVSGGRLQRISSRQAYTPGLPTVVQGVQGVTEIEDPRSRWSDDGDGAIPEGMAREARAAVFRNDADRIVFSSVLGTMRAQQQRQEDASR